MNAGDTNNTPGREIEDALRAVDSAIPARGALEAMRRDRGMLRAALQADLSAPLARAIRERLDQSVQDELDRRLIAGLEGGRSLPTPPLAWTIRPERSFVWGRVAAIAAMIAVVGGVAWLAMQRPGVVGPRPLATSGPRELPEWAVLPPKKESPELPAPPTNDKAPAQQLAHAEPTATRDAALAVAWARKGMLAIRVTSDSPRRDRERLESIAQRDRREAAWALSTQSPVGLASVPSRPWPIDATLAGSESGDFSAARHPDTATVAGFDLAVRPTAEALESLRAQLEEMLAGSVTFERVDALGALGEQKEAPGAIDSAADVTWWKKPVQQWSPRLRLPLVLEFGEPAKLK